MSILIVDHRQTNKIQIPAVGYVYTDSSRSHRQTNKIQIPAVVYVYTLGFFPAKF